MAGLPLGGGKSVLLAGPDRTKSPDYLHAFGKAVDHLGGRYVTAEDVGMSVADMIEVHRSTQFVAGLPNSTGDVGGDPGPHTSLGVFLGIKAAVKRALGKDNLSGLHIAMQGAGSIATGVALHACAEGARLSIADVDDAKAQKLAAATSGTVVPSDEILGLEADVISPNALGAILTAESIATLRTPIVAGGANNQLATPDDGQRLHARGILYAPDYVINAGGIINVCTEYLGDGDASLVRQRIEGVPVRLEQIWADSQESGRDPAASRASIRRRWINRSCQHRRVPRPRRWKSIPETAIFGQDSRTGSSLSTWPREPRTRSSARTWRASLQQTGA
jgi:leucine dehydrogenase